MKPTEPGKPVTVEDVEASILNRRAEEQKIVDATKAAQVEQARKNKEQKEKDTQEKLKQEKERREAAERELHDREQENEELWRVLLNPASWFRGGRQGRASATSSDDEEVITVEAEEVPDEPLALPDRVDGDAKPTTQVGKRTPGKLVDEKFIDKLPGLKGAPRGNDGRRQF